jgi:short-chain fatty acids transporter
MSTNASRLERFTRTLGNLVPDATSASVILLLLVALAALAAGNTPIAVVDGYYRGLWMLLPFTMQMTLILVLSSVVSATPLFRRAVIALADVPRSLAQVVSLSVGLCAALSYLYWGLGIALGPLIAVHFSAAAERKRIPVDFPFLLAAVAASQAVWQFGLSSSAALLMATPGHFLESTVGVMSLRSTIWSPQAVLISLLFPVGIVLVTLMLMPRQPRPLSAFAEASGLVSEPDRRVPPLHPDEQPAGFAAWVERSSLITATLGLALASWLHHHFVTRGSSLDLNAMNTILLLAALVLHRNVAGFSKAIQGAVQVCWPILVLYHLYGGVAGLLQYTSVGERFASAFAAFSTPLTFPLLTALASSILAVFIPSSGGQWVVQGFVTAKAAAAVGTTAQRGLLAVGVGDHMGNFLSPFWVVVIAGIARIDFRVIFGYGVIFALLWFALGVAVITVVR